MLHFLFPSDDFDPKVVDPDYADELTAVRVHGINHSLFSFEDFKAGTFKAIPNNLNGKTVVYRGWMMTPEQYQALNDALVTNGARLLTSPEQYRKAHHLPEWYDSCREFTPQTIIVPQDADFVAAVKDLSWDKYFVKDYVKSLSTGTGPIAETPEQIQGIVEQMAQYRGFVEGGVCIREVESLLLHTECRYFVVNGTAWGPYGNVPEVVNLIASRIDSPFFSIDMVCNADQQLRLIEIGDGQVSSRKEWTASDFIIALAFGLVC